LIVPNDGLQLIEAGAVVKICEGARLVADFVVDSTDPIDSESVTDVRLNDPSADPSDLGS